MDQIIISQLKAKLVGRQLLGIDCYNINDNYFVYEEESLAIVDGGISLNFSDFRLALGWNSEREIHTITEESVLQLFANHDYYKISSNNFPFNESILGETVSSINTEWTWFKDFGEYMEPVGPRIYTLHGIVIYFEDGQTLQIATVNYDLQGEDFCNFRFSVDGELMLSVNKVIDISDR